MLLPVIFYTPETELAGGVSAMRYFRPEGTSIDARPSKIWATFILTQRSQYIADLFNEFYVSDEKYLVVGGISYVKFPDKFYGIGPDTPDSLVEDYTPKTLGVYVRAQQRIVYSFNLGLLYHFANAQISETTPGGLLDSGVIPGSEGGIVSGVGATLNWDSRDNLFYPTSGGFHAVSVSVYGGALGSDYDFGKYVIDLRKYASLHPLIVLAVQGVLNSSSGIVPFNYLGQLGGQNILRGYYQGRYRDRHAVFGQVELRTMVWWRLGAAVFAGAGNVAKSLNEFDRDYIRYSGGFGLRYLFDKNEGLNIRLDFGYGEDTSGMYITAQEAF
jgi:outer membrane protein assembly factor BamA